MLALGVSSKDGLTNKGVWQGREGWEDWQGREGLGWEVCNWLALSVSSKDGLTIKGGWQGREDLGWAGRLGVRTKGVFT